MGFNSGLLLGYSRPLVCFFEARCFFLAVKKWTCSCGLLSCCTTLLRLSFRSHNVCHCVWLLFWYDAPTVKCCISFKPGWAFLWEIPLCSFWLTGVFNFAALSWIPFCPVSFLKVESWMLNACSSLDVISHQWILGEHPFLGWLTTVPDFFHLKTMALTVVHLKPFLDLLFSFFFFYLLHYFFSLQHRVLLVTISFLLGFWYSVSYCWKDSACFKWAWLGINLGCV